MTSTPKPKIPEDTYQALMEATFRALCKHGYTGLRVRDIDEEFEKSRQLINHYYDGKDDLIEAVLKYLLAEYERGITVGEDADPEAQLERYIQRFLHGQDIDGFDHWKFITALIELRSQAQHHPRHQEYLTENYRQLIETLAEIIEAGIEKGVFREVDAEQFARTITDIIDSARTRKVCLGDDQALTNGRETLDTLILPQLRRQPDDE